MAYTLRLKGFNYPAYYNGAYENADSLPALAATGANTVALNIEYGIDADNSTVYSDASYTDSLTALGNAIKEATADGLSVMVRPLIDFLDPSLSGSYSVGDWRSYYNPTDPAAFFASYKTMIVDEATVAQANGATSLCIGTELDQLTGPAYLSYWTGIISAVRSVFSGTLTYSADWNDATSPWQGVHGLPTGTGNLATQVSFWNQLDYLGIDEYAPLSDAANPTLADLQAGWTQVPTDAATRAVTGDQSLISYYESVSTAVGKPLLFTELGYENATDAASQPSGSSTNQPDAPLQSNLYQAFFNAWSQSAAPLAGVYFWNWDPNASEVGPGEGVNFSPQGQPAQTVVDTEFAALCFVSATRIATPAGEVAVEALTIGDTVKTMSGALRMVRWIGYRHLDLTRHPTPDRVQPILIRASAFADNVPQRDLFLSPEHAVLRDGLLIPVRLLVNGASIQRDTARRVVTYYHIELDAHDIMLAENLPAESYLDTGNRSWFENAGVPLLLHPDLANDQARRETESCLPFAYDPDRVEPIWRALAVRAAQLGWELPPEPETTGDPALCLTVDGRRVAPVSLESGRYVFVLRSAATEVRLVSRCALPAETRPWVSDDRRLGVMLRGLTFRSGASVLPLPLDHPVFGEGWWQPEWHGPTALCRWTNGDAVVPMPGADLMEPGQCVLEVQIAATLAYRLLPSAFDACNLNLRRLRRFKLGH